MCLGWMGASVGHVDLCHVRIVSMSTEEYTWKQLLNLLVRGNELDSAQITWAMDQIMTGATEEPIIASFLTALHTRGESPAELAALAAGMLAKAQPVDIDPNAVDIVGTGGDQQNTVNISTMAALVIAGAGMTVVKHGNRASTSKSGSADVLEALGIRLDMPVERVAQCARETGITFLFAQVFHPSMRFVGPVRRLLGIPTAFNYLGPMTNPARVHHSAIGVANERMAPKIAQVFADRGDHALVFRGDDGLDELAINGTSRVWEAVDGSLTEYVFDPADYGVPYAPLEALRGGDAEHNAGVFRAILSGAGAGGSAEDAAFAPIREAVLINAAAALVASRPVAGEEFSVRFERALADAHTSIDSGAAADVLQKWIDFSNAE